MHISQSSAYIPEAPAVPERAPTPPASQQETDSTTEAPYRKDDVAEMKLMHSTVEQLLVRFPFFSPPSSDLSAGPVATESTAPVTAHKEMDAKAIKDSLRAALLKANENSRKAKNKSGRGVNTVGKRQVAQEAAIVKAGNNTKAGNEPKVSLPSAWLAAPNEEAIRRRYEDVLMTKLLDAAWTSGFTNAQIKEILSYGDEAEGSAALSKMSRLDFGIRLHIEEDEGVKGTDPNLIPGKQDAKIKQMYGQFSADSASDKAVRKLSAEIEALQTEIGRWTERLNEPEQKDVSARGQVQKMMVNLYRELNQKRKIRKLAMGSESATMGKARAAGEANTRINSGRNVILNEWRGERIKTKARSKAETGKAEATSTPLTLENLGLKNIVKPLLPDPAAVPPVYRVDLDAPLDPRGGKTTIHSMEDIHSFAREICNSNSPFVVVRVGERVVAFVLGVEPGLIPRSNLVPRFGNVIDALSFRPIYEKAPDEVQQDEPEETVEAPDHGSFPESERPFSEIYSPDGPDMLVRFLSEHLENQALTGAKETSIEIMSPVVPLTQSQLDVMDHLCYAGLDYRYADHHDLLARFRELGCRVSTRTMSADDAFKDKGVLDTGTDGLMLRITLENGAFCQIVWGGDDRSNALVTQVFNAPGKSELPFKTNAYYEKKPSDFLAYMGQEAHGRCIKEVQATHVQSSPGAKILAALAHDPSKEENSTPESHHVKLLQFAKADRLAYASVASSYALWSHAFTESDKTKSARAITYELKDEQYNAELGRMLDASKGNLVIEYTYNTWDRSTQVPLKILKSFAAPGQVPDAPRTGISPLDPDDVFDGLPSEFLQEAINRRATEVRVLSRLPIADVAEPNVPLLLEQFKEPLTTLGHIGLPVALGNEPEFQKKLVDFAQFMYHNYPRCKDVTSEMYARFLDAINTLPQTKNNPIVFSHTLHQLDFAKINVERPALLQFHGAYGLVNITFHKDKNGNTIFLDDEGMTHTASDIEDVAAKQRWLAKGPITVLRIEDARIGFVDVDLDAIRSSRVNAFFDKRQKFDIQVNQPLVLADRQSVSNFEDDASQADYDDYSLRSGSDDRAMQAYRPRAESDYDDSQSGSDEQALQLYQLREGFDTTGVPLYEGHDDGDFKQFVAPFLRPAANHSASGTEIHSDKAQPGLESPERDEDIPWTDQSPSEESEIGPEDPRWQPRMRSRVKTDESLRLVARDSGFQDGDEAEAPGRISRRSTLSRLRDGDRFARSELRREDSGFGEEITVTSSSRKSRDAAPRISPADDYEASRSSKERDKERGAENRKLAQDRLALLIGRR